MCQSKQLVCKQNWIVYQCLPKSKSKLFKTINYNVLTGLLPLKQVVDITIVVSVGQGMHLFSSVD